MTLCKIIEDCSPYYVRFTFEGLDRLIELCNTVSIPDRVYDTPHNVIHIHLQQEIVTELLSILPFGNKVEWNKNRATFFVTEPGVYYGAHKDGKDCKVSFNFAISILDDKCITHWYNENEFDNYEICSDYIPSLDYYTPKGFVVREVLNWDPSKHTPVKTMIMQPNEVVLFNTDIYHNWDNSQSNNRRVILTLRHLRPGTLSFTDAKNLILSS